MIARSNSTRARLASATLACGICLAAAASPAFATSSIPASSVAANVPSLEQRIDGLTGDGVVEPFEPGVATSHGRDGLLGRLLDESSAKAIVIVTPGTDDGGLALRNAGLIGSRAAVTIDYAQSFWPIIDGKSDSPFGLPIFAKTYSASAAEATAANLAVMAALGGISTPIVYTGYSQGAEALGNAAEKQVQRDRGKSDEDKVLRSNTLILLVSDPRSPWGIKGFSEDLPLSDLWVTPALSSIGIDNDGARDPNGTDDARVTSVIVKGDPAADWQWKWHRPLSSLLVNGAGFLSVHLPGDGPYGQLDGKGVPPGKTPLLVTRDDDGEIVSVGEDAGPEMLYSAQGKTSYAVYDTYHPLALVNARLHDAVGLGYGRHDLARWDKDARTFYPMDDVTEENTRSGVEVGAAKPEGPLSGLARPRTDSPLTGTAGSSSSASSAVQSADAPESRQPRQGKRRGGKHRLAQSDRTYVPRHGQKSEVR